MELPFLRILCRRLSILRIRFIQPGIYWTVLPCGLGSADAIEKDMASAGFDLKLQVIDHIGKAKSIAEAAMAFTLFEKELTGCRFVFAADIGGQPGFAINKTFSSGAAIRSLFQSERVVVVDHNSIAARDGGYDYAYDYSISLDTSAVSVLKPFLDGRKGVPEDIAEVIEFLTSNHASFDPLPYAFENFANLDRGIPTAERMYEKALGYETLASADLDYLKQTGTLRTRLDPDSLARRAARMISTMYDGNAAPGFVDEMSRLRRAMYALLLKMAVIQIRDPRRSLKQKLGAFLSFCDQDLATMHLRELVIAKEYFERGQGLGFFSRVHKNYNGEKSLFEVLENMAWDIYHLRHLELTMGISRSSDAKYFFSALLTFDKHLIELLDLCSLRAIALIGYPPRPIPFPKTDVIPFLDPEDVDKVFSVEAIHSRNLRRSEANLSLPRTILVLENQLAEAACIAPRIR